MAGGTTKILLEHIRELEERLDEVEETLRALRSGEVDAIVASGPSGDQVYTLKGADEAYRMMVERMNKGALTLALDGLILFSNGAFATMVRKPLERVIGSHILDFFAPEDADLVYALLSGSDSREAEVRLRRNGATVMPVSLSVEKLFWTTPSIFASLLRT